jgi:hypothetical protein
MQYTVKPHLVAIIATTTIEVNQSGLPLISIRKPCLTRAWFFFDFFASN